MLRKRYELLVSVPGITQATVVHLVADLSTLPSNLSVRGWIAPTGFDPPHELSGGSVGKASRISRAGSRHLQHARLSNGELARGAYDEPGLELFLPAP